MEAAEGTMIPWEGYKGLQGAMIARVSSLRPPIATTTHPAVTPASAPGLASRTLSTKTLPAPLLHSVRPGLT